MENIEKESQEIQPSIGQGKVYEIRNIFSKHGKIFLFFVAGIALLVFCYIFLFSAPDNFPVGTIVEVAPGMSLRSLSYTLKKEDAIRSRTVFEYLVMLLGGEKHINSADYILDQKLSVWQIAARFARGEHRMTQVSVTVPEGFNNEQIAEVMSIKLVDFNTTGFLSESENMQGYLFPDTYFFLPNATKDDVIKSMQENFNKKISPLLPAINSSGKTEAQIIIMASIIEREAKGDDDRAVISGILWKRIKIGMPLEVDAAPVTYHEKGLPSEPISNPGIKAIEAAINPETTDYLYYLHDKEGNIHYAKTFAEHSSNIKKYLK